MDQVIAASKQLVLNKVAVTHQQVIIAKAFVVVHVGQASLWAEGLRDSFLTHMHAEFPKDAEIVLPRTGDATTILDQLAASFSWELALSEAVWGLIHANYLLPASAAFTDHNPRTFRTRWGSTTSFGPNFSFPELQVQLPQHIRRAPSGWKTAPQPLSDADLYLHEIDIPHLNPEIVTDLREAVNCFRHELYTACLAMLGKASEAVWSETGSALVKAFPAIAESQKLEKLLGEPNTGIGQIIAGVRKLYERQDLILPVIEQSGIKPAALAPTLVWAEAVRDARNVLHYGTTPAMSNSYEKVAALLIGTVPSIRTLYTIKAAAEEIVANLAAPSASH